MKNRLEQALEECLHLLRQGVSLEECLNRYPEEAEELAPLLRAANLTRQNLSFDVPSAARLRMRARVMDKWSPQQAPTRPIWRIPAMFPRWAAVAASLIILLLLSGIGTVSAAGGAIPGDSLYPVKTGMESIRLAFAFSEMAKADVHIDLAERRAEEIARLAENERPELIEATALRLESHLQVASGVKGNGAAMTKLKSRIEKSATAQLAKLEHALAEVPGAARDALRQALVALGERYAAAIDTISGGVPPIAPSEKFGMIHVFVTDPPRPNVDHVWIEVSEISVHRAGGNDSAWATIVEEPVRFDLLAVIGIHELLGSREIPVGFYTQMRITITGCTIITGNEEHTAHVPSGTMKFPRPFTVEEGKPTTLVLDFDGEKSLVTAGARQYVLKPVVTLLVPGRAGGEDAGPPGGVHSPQAGTDSNGSEANEAGPRETGPTHSGKNQTNQGSGG
ncbi:MAG: DUF4382 domain-containing protein [Dehalococcoidia bacterium]|nr:DUF4382 domain-containing protein [Dehalococcoidia bacterium]